MISGVIEHSENVLELGSYGFGKTKTLFGLGGTKAVRQAGSVWSKVVGKLVGDVTIKKVMQMRGAVVLAELNFPLPEFATSYEVPGICSRADRRCGRRRTVRCRWPAGYGHAGLYSAG